MKSFAEIKDDIREDEVYKHLYVENAVNISKRYTQCKMGEDDYLSSPVWAKKRDERLKRDSFKCVKCGSPYALEVHHIKYPIVWGAEDVERDLVTLCDRCHKEIHNK